MDLFSTDVADMEKSIRLMKAIDGLTDRYGMDSIKLGAQETQKPVLDLSGFQALRNQTTNIDDIIVVN